jgi:LmbE family N-acetylglucosaminyl deacetylase
MTEDAEGKLAGKRKRLRRRLWFYGTFVALLWGFYVWQPIQVDLFPRSLPLKASVDPDSAKLFAKGTRVMVIVGHPDDSEFYAAGTLLKLGQVGAELRQLLHTDGDKAYYFWADNSALREIRQAEQRKASARWGARELRFLGSPDGRLRKNEETVAKTAEVLREWKPEYVLCFDPEYPPRSSHQDHRRSGEIAMEACRAAKFTGWVLQFSTRAQNYAVNVDKEWTERLELLAIHASQFSGERLRFIQAHIADSAVAQAGDAGFSFGEGFRCVRFENGMQP